MNKKRRNYKNIFIWFFCGISILTAALCAGCLWKSVSNTSSNRVRVKEEKIEIKINKTPDVFNDNYNSDFQPLSVTKEFSDIKINSIQENDLYSLNAYFNRENFNIPEEKNEKVNGLERYYYSFVSPFSGVEFRDFSYGVDEDGNRRYLLGSEGLLFLDYLFNKKVTFGPEVFSLKAININDFEITSNRFNGFYVPNIKEIFINGSSLSEKGITLNTKGEFLINTIFHEYMHHWTNEYAEIGLDNFNQNLYTKIISEEDEGRNNPSKIIKYNYWNKYFISNFKKILGFDNHQLTNKDSQSGFVYSNFSLSDLWNISNNEVGLNDAKYKELNKLSNTRFYNFGVREDQYNTDRLKYYYSIDELVPREWTKIAYSPFNKFTDDKEFIESTSNENILYRANWKGLEEMKKINGNPSDDSYHHHLIYSALFSDSLKTRPGLTKYFADNVSNIEYEEIESVYPNNTYKSNKTQDLYNLYLNTMNYGYNISLMFSPVAFEITTVDNFDVKVSENQRIFSYIYLAGYLKENQNYDGFVLKTKSGSYELLEFSKHTEMNFNANKIDYFTNKDYDEDDKFKPNGNLIYYVTKKTINLKEINLDENLKWWSDLNKDGELQNNEIFDETITLNPHTTITNSRSVNKNFKKNVAYLENKNNKVKIHYNS